MIAYPDGGGVDPLFGGRDPDGGGADPLFGGRDPDDGGGALSLPFGGGSAEPKSKKLSSNLSQSTNLLLVLYKITKIVL